MKYEKFLGFLSDTEKTMAGYILDASAAREAIRPAIIQECTLSYVKRSGKKLRPAVLLLSCMAVGGDKKRAIPAAAAVELFHTWTLVHDDIIDNDNTRRGVETVHKTAERYALEQLHLPAAVAAKYGTDTAILTGDVQHGWAISFLSHNLVEAGVSPAVALHLITLLQTDVLRTLVEGEVLDVDFGLYYDFSQMNDDMVLDMLWRKTGILYKFCGIAGAMIGRDSVVYDDELHALQEFCSLCGTAFQVRDDILGLVGKEKELGKPVGSDIREGKKTILVLEALRNGTLEQRELILSILGNEAATLEQIHQVTALIIELGGVEKAHQVAQHFVDKAMAYLQHLKPSESRDLLAAWAEYLIDRNF